ncbi:MAG: hypothetical protein QM755_04825 [Luteolibacter sp.]
MSPKSLIPVMMLAAVGSIHAETELEKEVSALDARYEASMTSAFASVNQTYKGEVEKLLRKETQGGDLQAAAAYRTELETLDPDKAALARRLTSTIWDYRWRGQAWKFSLEKNGAVNSIDVKWPGAVWKVTGPLEVTIYWSKKPQPMVLKFASDLGSFTNRNWDGEDTGASRSYSATRH